MVCAPCLENIGHAAFIPAAKDQAFAHAVMHLIQRAARYEDEDVHVAGYEPLLHNIIAHIDGDAYRLLSA